MNFGSMFRARTLNADLLPPGVSTMRFHGREDKIESLGRHFSSILVGRVLDVGCDAGHLHHLVRGWWVGLDFAGAPTVRGNLDDGLPFSSASFDTVIALDVLEHCDRIHFVFDELCRVCQKSLVVALPNMYEWHFRLRFLAAKKLGGK